MRLAIFVLAVCACILGGYQIANMWVAGAAAPGSLIALLPAREIPVVSQALVHAVPAYFERRYIAETRVSRLESRRDARQEELARSSLAALPVTGDVEAMRARLAYLRGEHDLAFRIALRAHSARIVDQEIQRAAASDTDKAVDLQERVVQSLLGERTHREALADAYWHLGVLHNTAAERTHEAVRQVHRERAKQAFADNVRLTPLSGRALLSAAYAEFALGRLDSARRYFSDARASDPASASAYVGLARVAFAAGRCDEAADFARTATRLQPQQADVVQLRNDGRCRR